MKTKNIKKLAEIYAKVAEIEDGFHNLTVQLKAIFQDLKSLSSDCENVEKVNNGEEKNNAITFPEFIVDALRTDDSAELYEVSAVLINNMGFRLDLDYHQQYNLSVTITRNGSILAVVWNLDTIFFNNCVENHNIKF